MTFNRTERALAFMIGGIIILGVLCFIAMIIMWLTDSSAQGSMPWPVVMAIPLVGFPIAMLLVFTLLGITWTRRARANRTAR
ncbi:multidrug ABC transporter ATPase [Curtobacterium sp. MCLR17_036]|uniref:multidrug ABC transporter ATPase n=1 Tax=Curtobacterium sp. MCLR17_036 TaxID=2175620 RepID=UPI0024DF3976|nr:multidrug ABC transporter ATPase [Curtobacterium sp. MCLR17_036]WIE64482.1 multidrug ABC transporter ATPase [Curtobacterium sp. MCLR17_036]